MDNHVLKSFCLLSSLLFLGTKPIIMGNPASLLPPKIRIMRCFLFASILCLTYASAIAQDTYVTPQQAKSDPDFELQGEYTDSTRGLQVIALGDGEFQVVTYTDGLPGAGWNRKDKKSIEVDADAVEALLRNFKRVERKSPTLGAKPPGGSVVLFDGTKASLEKHWKKGAKITDSGLLQQGCTSIDTFGDYTLHLEFRTPFKPKARGQGRGNSGVYHQGRFETQVLDSFGLEGQMNETGGIYSIRKPDLNMCFPPLTWQTYDVDFTAATFKDGKKVANAKMTVKLNGIVVHRDVELPKTTTAAPMRDGPEDGPIYIQNHGNPVHFRNIWVLPRDLSAEARRPIVPAFQRFHVSAGDPTDGGQLLLGELNCVACHKAEQSMVSLINPKQAPILNAIGKRVRPEWLVKYIANPHDVKAGTTMPDLMTGKSQAERKEAAIAITNFLVGDDVIDQGGKGANTDIGKKLFHESGCVACHLPRDGRSANTATSIPLGELGEKYSRASLERFLRDPMKVRPSGRMPQIDLGGDNWRHVAQYLTGDLGVTFGNRRDLPKNPNMRFKAYYKGVSNLPDDLDQMKPDKEGISRGLDISAGQRNENVIIRFNGFLPITTAGKYSFRLGSDDGSRLYIDGKRIINNDGTHPTEFKEGSLNLSRGLHEIQVDWFEAGGDEELSLVWLGPGIKSGAIDKAIVMNRDGTDLPPATPKDELDPDTFVFDESKVDQGRELFTSLGCASCHVRDQSGTRVESSLVAPTLAAIKSDAAGCLGDPKTGIPNFDLTGIQVTAITAALSAGEPKGEITPEMQIAHSMKSLNCYACHKRDGIGGAESDRNQYFVSTIPEMGDEGRLAPSLDGVGDKLREEWIKNVVTNGNKSRPYMKTYMPRFGNAAAGHLAKSLAAVDQRTEANIPNSDEPETRQVAFGRKMVGSKGLACVSCHTFGKFKSSGIQAIALDTMASRIREDWFHRYLPDPQQYRPGTRMPTGYPKGESTVKDVYDGDQSRQISAMWAFLSKGSKGGVPEGISGGSEELKPVDKPIIYRNFIEGVSPRGIAVGYPEKVNLCWDANNLSLTLIWQDRFIDASKHWQGRGQGNQVPLGGGVVTLEKVSPIAALANMTDPWPTGPPKERGYKFLGYRLDTQGRPTFRYRVDSIDIEDKPIPVAGDIVSTFRREVTAKPNGNVDRKYFFRAAAGKKIQPKGDAFVIDDTLTIRVKPQATIRETGGTKELLVPITGETKIVQQIIW